MTEQQYRDKLLSYLHRNTNSVTYTREKYHRNFDYFLGKFVSDKFQNLLTLHEGDGDEGNTPFVHLNYNMISSKVEFLIGEFERQGFEPVVSCTNLSAYKRRKAVEDQIRFLMKMQPMLQRAAQATGIPSNINPNLPKNDEELAEYMDNYVDVYEELLNEELRLRLSRYDYYGLRSQLFMDFVIGGLADVRFEKKGGKYRPVRTIPSRKIPDWGSDSPFFDDASFDVSAHYVSIPDAIENYDIEADEVKRLIKEYQRGTDNISMWKGGIISKDNKEIYAWPPFERHGSGWNNEYFDRILVIEGCWVDNTYPQQKVTYDKHGNEHVHEYDEDYKVNLSKKEQKAGGKVKKGYEQIVRYARMIGGHFLESYGEEGDYIRIPDDPAITKLKSVTTAYHFINQDYQSMVDRMESLEDFRDYVLTLMQKEITTSIGSVIEIDKSQIDKETYGVDSDTVDKVLHTLKAYNVIVTNKADGYQRNPNLNGKPINSLDLSQQGFIQSCIQAAAFIENEINRISGITEARQGQLGERALVRSSQMSIAQSSLMTTSLYTQFDRYERRIIERWVELIALEWANDKLKVEEVAARLNITIPEDFDPDLQKWDIDIRKFPLTIEELKQAGMASVEQGSLMMHEYMEILMIAGRKSFYQATQKYVEITKNRLQKMQEAQAQQAQAAQQQEQQLRIAQMQQQAQANQQKANTERYKTDRNAEVLERNKELEVGQRDRAAVASTRAAMRNRDNETDQ